MSLESEETYDSYRDIFSRKFNQGIIFVEEFEQKLQNVIATTKMNVPEEVLKPHPSWDIYELIQAILVLEYSFDDREIESFLTRNPCFNFVNLIS